MLWIKIVDLEFCFQILEYLSMMRFLWDGKQVLTKFTYVSYVLYA
jgi:hypothetical protein